MSPIKNPVDNWMRTLNQRCTSLGISVKKNLTQKDPTDVPQTNSKDSYSRALIQHPTNHEKRAWSNRVCTNYHVLQKLRGHAESAYYDKAWDCFSIYAKERWTSYWRWKMQSHIQLLKNQQLTPSSLTKSAKISCYLSKYLWARLSSKPRLMVMLHPHWPVQLRRPSTRLLVGGIVLGLTGVHDGKDQYWSEQEWPSSNIRETCNTYKQCNSYHHHTTKLVGQLVIDSYLRVRCGWTPHTEQYRPSKSLPKRLSRRPRETVSWNRIFAKSTTSSSSDTGE